MESRYVIEARDPLRELVRIVIGINSTLNLETTLYRVIEGAIELTGARGGAIGRIDDDGDFTPFAAIGLNGVEGRAFADLPTDRVLRADDPALRPGNRVLRVNDMPPQALLGMPIVFRTGESDVLFLADDRSDEVFADGRRDAVRALTTAAAVAIDNARLFEREREAAKWTRASREITTALLSGAPHSGPLQLIVQRALELADAEQAILLVPSASDDDAADVRALVVAAAAGRYSSQVIGQEVPMDGSTTGGVARRGQPLITEAFQYPIEGFTDVGERSAIVMPLTSDDVVLGVIAVARHPQQPPFGEDYLDLVSDFARHAALALALAAGREHALNHQLAQADSVDDAVRAAAEELRRLWRARRVLTVTFPRADPAAHHRRRPPRVISVGDAAQWPDLPAPMQRALTTIADGDLLTPGADTPGTAGIAVQHPDGVMVVWIELSDHRPFTLEDLTLLAVLAGRLGPGLQRLHQVDQQREAALALQHAILGPAHLPAGFSVRYQAASRPLAVGGDWYDIIELDDGRIAFVVGDCVGHGLGAATVMGQVRSACRALLLDDPSPAVVLAKLDRFAARLPGARATTAVCAVLDPTDGELVYSSAGHPPPVLVDSDGSTSMLEDGHTIALGVKRDWPRPDARIHMPAGATLLLYTDGLIERREMVLDQGLARLTEAGRRGRSAALDDLADDIMSDLAPADGYCDDVVLMLYRHHCGPLSLDFPADAGEVAAIRAQLRTWLSGLRMDPDQTMDVLVSVGEAVANAIEHGHRRRPDGTVSLTATVRTDEVHLTVSDSGEWKTPETGAGPQRGRGIGLMRALMHDVAIDSGTSGTTVHLIARFAE